MSEPLIDKMDVPLVTVDWNRSTPWWRLGSHALSISCRMSHLIVSVVGIVLISFIWSLANRLFGIEFANPINPWSTEDPLFGIWNWLVAPIATTSYADESLLRTIAHRLFGLLGTAVVVGLLGGVMTRVSVVELGTRSSLGWDDAFNMVGKRFGSIFWTLLMPWVAIAILLIPICLLGLLGRLGSWGEGLAMIGMLPCFVLIIAIGWLSILGLLGFPLAITAVVTEKNADAFDGFSRAAAYLSQKILTLGVCVLVAWGIALAAAKVLTWGFTLGSQFVLQSFETTMGHAIARDSTIGGFLSNLVPGLVGAYAFSFFWTASAAIYLILRKEVDHTEYDDMELDKPTPAPEGEPRPTTEMSSSSEGTSETSTSGEDATRE